MFVSVLGVVIEGNVLSLLIELEVSGGRQTLGEGGLAVKLMGKLPGRQHGLRVNASSLRKPGIERERRRSGLVARLVG